MKIQRVKLNPRVMTDLQRRWMVKVAHSQFWRVASWYELDDLLQDGFLCHAKVVSRYPHVYNPAHLGKLFQTTFLNHIHTLATKRRHSISEVYLDDIASPPEPWEHPLVDPFSIDLSTQTTAGLSIP